MKRTPFTMVLKSQPPNEQYRKAYDNIDWSDDGKPDNPPAHHPVHQRRGGAAGQPLEE